TWIAPRGRDVSIQTFEPPEAAGLDTRGVNRNSSLTIREGVFEKTVTTTVTYRCAGAGEFDLGPLTVPYLVDGETLSTIAPTVHVRVLQTAWGRLVSTRAAKIALFVALLAAFWIVVLGKRRRAKRLAPVVAAAPIDTLERLARDARANPDSAFFARLEDATWRELFAPGPVPDETTTTRVSELSARGVPAAVLTSVRDIANLCARMRHDESAAKSVGEAVDAVRRAQAAVADARRAADRETD
ncbi:hypothetical protein K8I61_15640, partial [bacterium]|nr:hypothetical protein [bacterium]